MNIKVLFVSAFFESDGQANYTMPFIDRQMESLQRIGVEVVPYSLEIYKSRFNYFRFIKPISEFINSQRISIVHAHYSYSAIPCSIFKRAPVVVSLMGMDVYGDVGQRPGIKLKNLIDRMIIQTLSPRWDAVIVKSKRMRDHFRHPNINIIANGIDFDVFSPMDTLQARRTLGLDIHRPLIVFAGNPGDSRKNFALANGVYNSVLRDIKDVHMIPLKNIPHNRVPLYLNAACCLLMTSLKEGSPNIVKEALACNIPVVSVDVGDVAERLEGLDMCVVCNYDKNELAREVMRIIRNGKRPDNREPLTHLDIDIVAQRILDLYKDVLATNRRCYDHPVY